MFQQQLLLVWANYWLHHLLRVAAEFSLGAVIVSGAVTTVVAVVPIHHKAIVPKTTPVAVVHKVAPKPVAKPQITTPAPTPTPVVATPAPTPKPTPTPKPIASTQPSPGTGVKHLVPTSPPNSGGQSNQSSPPTNPPANSLPADATGGYYSTNWSGYAALTGSFTAVSGSWTVPAVTGNGSTTTADSAWIGIGGVSSNDLIQTGTTDMVEADGTVSYAVFYELLPDPALEVTGFVVQAGDVMTAAINEVSGNTWSITITDTTSGQTYSTSVTYASSLSSAEWIEEDPSYLNGSLVPFDNWNHVIFTSSATTVNGSSANLTTSNAAPITLVNNSATAIVTPSVLINSGTGFWATHN